MFTLIFCCPVFQSRNNLNDLGASRFSKLLRVYSCILVKKKSPCGAGLFPSVSTSRNILHSFLRIFCASARCIRKKSLELDNYIRRKLLLLWRNIKNRDFFAEYAMAVFALFNKDRGNKIGGSILLLVS